MTTPQDNKLMPGRDLDREVAEKVMGWEPGLGGIHLFPPKSEPNRKRFVNQEGETVIPHYSTSIEDAWEIVEKLNYCQVYKMGEVYTVTTDRAGGGACAQAQSNTAPHAICLAGLKAIEHE